MASNLKKIRIKRRKSEQDVADILKITERKYKDIENYPLQLNGEQISTLMKEFKVSADYILDKTWYPHSAEEAFNKQVDDIDTYKMQYEIDDEQVELERKRTAIWQNKLLTRCKELRHTYQTLSEISGLSKAQLKKCLEEPQTEYEVDTKLLIPLFKALNLNFRIIDTSVAPVKSAKGKIVDYTANTKINETLDEYHFLVLAAKAHKLTPENKKRYINYINHIFLHSISDSIISTPIKIPAERESYQDRIKYLRKIGYDGYSGRTQKALAIKLSNIGYPCSEKTIKNVERTSKDTEHTKKFEPDTELLLYLTRIWNLPLSYIISNKQNNNIRKSDFYMLYNKFIHLNQDSKEDFIRFVKYIKRGL